MHLFSCPRQVWGVSGRGLSGYLSNFVAFKMILLEIKKKYFKMMNLLQLFEWKLSRRFEFSIYLFNF